MDKRIIISSGEVNRYGYKVLAEGIVLDHYLKNPILLYNHDGNVMSIGKMNDLSIEDNNGRMMLTGVPEFDSDDPLAMDIARKYEKGYINACSIGHDPIEISSAAEHIEPGQVYETITKTELMEISMTNIPADREAVRMRLSTGELVSIPKLVNNINNNTMNDEIKEKLGLDVEAEDQEVLAAIDSLLLELKNAQSELEEALMELGTDNGHVTEETELSYRKMARTNYKDVKKIFSTVVKGPNSEDSKSASKLSIVEAIKYSARKSQGGQGASEATFKELSMDNPKELLRIQREEPERYKLLADAYVKAAK